MTKILVVEDEEQIRTEVMDWLQFEGYTVIGAENGLLGIEAAIRETPDLILCDVVMPEMDGHQVLLEVRSNPFLSHTPFIFLTARASRDAVREGMDLGADDYITKPFTLDEILSAVGSRLEKQAAQDSLVEAHLNVLNSELEEEREKRLLKSRLVAMFSHDFRNPLAAILSSVELIRAYDERLSPDRRRTHLDRMEGSVRLLLQMLDDMLLVAQMESGRLEYDPQLVDVSALVKAIVGEFALIHNETHTLSFHSDVQNSLEMDPKLFRQVAANLISNAVKYSPSGGEVTVTLTEGKDTFELVVRDQGIGIPEDKMSRLFEPFQRAANVKDVKGTGLGLPIVKQAVELCGGSIHVESVTGEGTRFVIQFPRKEVEHG
jgi:two-component system sensor histidine kinase/response regulator